MDVANASPLTKTSTMTAPLSRSDFKLPKEYEEMYGEYDLSDPDIRQGVINDIEYQQAQAAQKVRDLSTTGKDRPLFEKIMAMRGEMMDVESSRQDIKKGLDTLDDLTEQQAARSIASILKDEPAFSKYLAESFRQGEGHYENKRDTIDFVKEIYSKAGSSSKDSIKLKGEPPYSLDRFGAEPIEEDDGELEYDQEESDGSYTITRTVSKKYNLLKNINYYIEETFEYQWEVDAIEGDDGEMIPDDGDIDYWNADTKATYRLVKKKNSK